MNKHRLGALVAAAALTLTFAGTAFAGSLDWNGINGWPVADGCNQDDTPAGSMLWIYTGDSDSDVVLTMNGTEYTGVQKGNGNGSWHIITPFTDSKPDASIAFTGDYDNGVLTISHGCAGETTTSTETSSTTSSETTETSSTETTETSTTDTTETSTTDTTETSTTDTETTDTSTTATETTDTETTETTPSGSVEELTPPSTDTVATTGSSSTVSTGLLLVLAGILAMSMVVIPAAVRTRR